VQTLGLVVGAVWAGRLRGRLRLPVACLATAALVLPLVLLAGAHVDQPEVLNAPYVDPLHWAFWLCLGLFVSSVGLELFTVPLDVTIQTLVPRAYLGRVFGALTLATLAGIPVGELVVGPLADRFGTPGALFTLAGLIALVAVVVAVSPRVRRIDAPAVLSADERVGHGPSGQQPSDQQPSDQR
jgi:MFS family permease